MVDDQSALRKRRVPSLPGRPISPARDDRPRRPADCRRRRL